MYFWFFLVCFYIKLPIKYFKSTKLQNKHYKTKILKIENQRINIYFSFIFKKAFNS